MADLGVRLCGVDLGNPLVVSSGPLTYSAEGIKRTFAAGAAAAVTKTISLKPAINPTPHIAAIGHGSLLNTEKWADLPAGQWIEHELPALRGGTGLVIASVGHQRADVEALAAPLVAAGAGMLEVVSYDAADMVPLVAAAKACVAVPVLAKLSPNWPDLFDCAAGCLAAGADGLTAIDSLGPTLAIDVETGRPRLGGTAWLSGPAIKPLAVGIVASLCQRHPGVPVVATGGVSRAEDVAEMLMVGAAAVGVHTAPLLQGVAWLGKTVARLDHWLAAHGYHSVADLRGLALRHLPGRETSAPLEFSYRAELCTECGRCVTVCAYGARSLQGKEMILDCESCRYCGLCASVCPAGALAVQAG
jgi:dihydropyrimidine dehydrogenase (NAD+) subunit PreA